MEGIFQSTPDNGYIAVNPALARIYGYESPEELITKLRDIERLIRRTLPVSGDLSLVSAPVAAAPARPAGRPGARSARNPKADATRRRDGGERRPEAAKKSGEGRPGSWMTEIGKGGEPRTAPKKAEAGQAKPRWNRGQRNAAKARRSVSA